MAIRQLFVNFVKSECVSANAMPGSGLPSHGLAAAWFPMVALGMMMTQNRSVASTKVERTVKKKKRARAASPPPPPMPVASAQAAPCIGGGSDSDVIVVHEYPPAADDHSVSESEARNFLQASTRQLVDFAAWAELPRPFLVVHFFL